MTTPRTHFIGINVSGTQARAALVDSEGALIDGRVGEITAKQLVPQLATMVDDLRSTDVTIGAIGVAIPGLVNRQTDRVIAPRDLPSTILGDLHGELVRATGLRVELENDANAAAYGEFKAGAGLGARRRGADPGLADGRRGGGCQPGRAGRQCSHSSNQPSHEGL